MKIYNVLFRSKNYLKRLLKREKREYQHNAWQEKQNDFMQTCLASHKVVVRGVLHVGGHLGEEYSLYKAAGAEKVVFFEPMSNFYHEMARRLKGRKDVILVKKAMGSRNETKEMHVNRGNGESTSFLKPTALYDGFFEEKTVSLEIVTLDSFMPTLKDSAIYNMLVVDTQGFDLEVLKGAQNTLKQIDYIYTEVSKGHYQGEPILEDFDLFLQPFGFRRAELSMYGSWKGEDQWGDMFYIKGGPTTPGLVLDGLN